MDRHLRSVAIIIEVTSRYLECTYFHLDHSQMPAVAQQEHKRKYCPKLKESYV